MPIKKPTIRTKGCGRAHQGNFAKHGPTIPRSKKIVNITMIKLFANRIHLKADAKPGSGDVVLGKHAINGEFYQGKTPEFTNHTQLFDNMIGPFHNEHEAGAYFHHAGPTFQHPATMGFKPNEITKGYEAPANLKSSYAAAKNSAVPSAMPYKPPRTAASLVPDHGPAFRDIMKSIKGKKGSPLIVGGAVRDHVLGKHPEDVKDVDVEVHGMDADKLAKTLGKFGQVNAVGASFGVIKLTTPDGQDYDFSLPRRENKEGQGHKGFQVQPDATMSPKEAASRRDFTFNSLGQDPDTGAIHDYYGGLNDLKTKTLRATTPKFAEDPLRVLRGMQFAARMGLTMDPETAKMSKSLLPEYDTLSKDRIATEWAKLAEKGIEPSKGLQILKDTDWITKYPELHLTPKKMMAADNIAKTLQSNEFSPPDKNALFMANLIHDMTTKDATSFLNRVGMSGTIQKRALALKNGMNSSHHNADSEANANNLAFNVAPERIENLMHVLKAQEPANELLSHHQNLNATAHRLGVHQAPPQPIINGDWLMQHGIKPGPELGHKLKKIYQAQLDGLVSTPEDAVKFI